MTVHVAVTRRVRPGMEHAFEERLRDFARRSLHASGTTGVNLIGPPPGAQALEYGILRSFESEAACQLFYESELFRQWQEEVEPFVDGEPVSRRLHGLEAFFRQPGRAVPPKWKMAVLTWLGVFPAVLLWSSLLGPPLSRLPAVFVTAIVSAAVVVTLAWVIMPTLTLAFARWLHSN